MSLQEERNLIISHIETLTDERLLWSIKRLLNIADEPSEAMLASINRGLKDAEEGRTHDHSDAEKIYKRWRSK